MTKLPTLYRPLSQAKVTTDVLVSAEVIKRNQEKLSQMPGRKRRRDYAKKIMNDPFIFSV